MWFCTLVVKEVTYMNQETLQLGQTEISEDGLHQRQVVDRNAENEPAGWEVGESYWGPCLAWSDWEPIQGIQHK